MIFFNIYYDNDVDENENSDDDDATQWAILIEMRKTKTGNELIECEKLKWKHFIEFKCISCSFYATKGKILVFYVMHKKFLICTKY